MKKIIIIALLSLSLNTTAQFIDKKAPTKSELAVNNAKDLNTLLRLAYKLKADENYKDLVIAMEKLVDLKPKISDFKFQLAEAYSLADEKTKAFNALIMLQKQGLYFDLDKSPSFENIKSYPVYKYIKENIDVNGVHFGEGTPAFNINKSFSGLLFESIIFDSKNQAILMGSLRDGRVIKVADNGEITTLIEPTIGGAKGPWSVTDMAVDPKNNVLWVASAAVSQFGKLSKESAGISGIFKYNLSTGKLIKSYLLPENKRPSMISSINLTTKGDLFFVGSIKNVVLKISKDSDQISLAFTTKKYKNLENITSDDTGNILYITDREEGIIILNLLSQEIYYLASNEALNLVAITDILFDDNGLIIFQNHTKPERVMRLQLNKSKFVIENVFPIESSNPSFDALTKAVIVGEGIFYIANSQMPKTNMYGGLTKGNEWEDMIILSSPKHYQEKERLEYLKEVEKQKKNSGAK